LSVYITVDGLEWIARGGMIGAIGDGIFVYLIESNPGTDPHISFGSLDLWPDQTTVPEIIGPWVFTEAGHTLRGTPFAVTVGSSTNDQPWGYAVCYETGAVLYVEGREFDWGPVGEDAYESILTTNLALAGCQV